MDINETFFLLEANEYLDNFTLMAQSTVHINLIDLGFQKMSRRAVFTFSEGCIKCYVIFKFYTPIDMTKPPISTN